MNDKRFIRELAREYGRENEARRQREKAEKTKKPIKTK